MVIAPTSAGKSAIYQLPALVMAEQGKWTLVIEPTLSLISDQVQKLQDKGINAAYVTSRNKAQHCAIYRRLNLNAISILYTTPEQVATVAFQLATWYNKPWLVVIDEAHCVLDWGTTFRPDYLELKESIAWMAFQSHRPVIAAFTATAPPDHRPGNCKAFGNEETQSLCYEPLPEEYYLTKGRLFRAESRTATQADETFHSEVRPGGQGGRVLFFAQIYGPGSQLSERNVPS